jgi:hypothetical protein
MSELTIPAALAEALAVARGVINPDALLDGEWRDEVQRANRIIAALRERGFDIVRRSAECP